MASKQVRSSYRNKFGNKTAFSTAGSRSYNTGFGLEDTITPTRVSYSYSASSSAPVGSVTVLDGDFRGINLNEKETLNGINNRFANYIEKVRFLEERNSQLERLIKEAGAKKETDLGEEKRRELKRLRALVDDAALAKARSEILRDNLHGEASELKWKLEHEARLRSDLDSELGRLRKDVDDATMVRVDLERKIESLGEEVEYGKKMHNEEIDDLKDQIKNQSTSVEVDAGVGPDITDLLCQIRAEYEDIVLKNRNDAEQWYKSRFEDLQDRAKSNTEDLGKVHGEINDYRKQIAQLEMELESLRGSNEYLERNLADVERRHEFEASRYQTKLESIAGELDNATADMKRHLAEYKRLMSVKKSLEKEIKTYRRLLEGDDSKLDSSSSSSSSSNNSSRRSSSSGGEEEIKQQSKPTKTVLIKTIDTRDGKIVSSSVAEKEVVQERLRSGNSSDSSSSSSSDED